MVSINDVLKASKGLPVDDIFAELWGRKLSGDYTIAVYTGTLPAVLSGTKAGYLHRYKVYGNVGENLFNLNRLPSDTWTTDTQYYMNGGIATTKAVSPSAVTISVNNDTLSVTTNSANGAGFLVEVKPSTEYRLVFAKSESLVSSKTSCTYALVNSSETIGQPQGIYGDADGAVITTDSNTKYIYFVFRKSEGTISYSSIMLTEGSTPPESYIPYEECGERTENLYNFDESSQGDGYTANKFMVSTGVASTNDFFISEYIPVIPGQTYTYFTDLFRTTRAVIKFYNITNANEPVTYVDQTPQKSVLSSVSYSLSECATFTVPTDTSRAITHMRISVDKESTMFFIIAGSTPPESYIPYGYKLPLLSGSTPVDIYIGDDTLSAEEYVDSGTGKIYRMVNGVLTPVDPPVPFPQIPTAANSTTISWAGQGLEPSEVEFEYERK